MNQEILTTLKDILFQLHVITSQNFIAMAQTQGEDPASEKTREYGMSGLDKENSWMNAFVKARNEEECAFGTYSSSES